MSAQIIASLVLVGVAAISSVVASRALRRVSELKEHIRDIERQLTMKREWEDAQARNRKEADAKIGDMHDGDVVGNALGVLSKRGG